MTTYIATIKRLADSEIIDQTHDTDIRMLALHLFTVLKDRGWTGGPNPTMAKLAEGQAVIHNGFEYVITRKVNIRLRPHATHRGRLEELLQDMGVDYETMEQMTGLTLLVALNGGGSFICWFDADGSHAHSKP